MTQDMSMQERAVSEHEWAALEAESLCLENEAEDECGCAECWGADFAEASALPVEDSEGHSAPPLSAKMHEASSEGEDSESLLQEQALGRRIASREAPDADRALFDVRTAPLCIPTLLEASAGTGKTYSIKHLVLRLIVERNMRIDQLLIVTFTKDATAELGMRIREHLSDALRALEGEAEDEGDPLIREQIALWKAWGMESSEALQRIRASLTHFDDAAIHTIHAFCQKMLSNRAFSAGLPFGFEKGDEDVLEALVDEVLEDHLRRALDAEPDPKRRAVLADMDWRSILVACAKWPEQLVAREIVSGEVDAALLPVLETFVREAPEALRRSKQERRIFDYDDLLTDLWRALSEEGDNGPFARSLRRMFTGVLIDEFQDTDPVQFDIMRRLFMSGLTARERRERALFFVGDPKQAIYSFRGADLNTYLEARARIEGMGRRQRLGCNYRSSAELVKAVNAFFSKASGDGAFLREELRFEPVDAGSTWPGLCFRNDDGTMTPAPPMEFWSCSRPYENQDLRRAETGEAAARDIVRLLSEGRAGRALLPCKDKHGSTVFEEFSVRGRTFKMRPVEAGDIAVLVRNRSHADELMASLMRWGVRCRIQRDDDVMRTIEAREMGMLLRALRRPGDVNAVNGARATRILGETLAQIDAADEAARVEARTMIEEALKLWPRGGAAAVIRRIMRDRRVAQRILPKVGGERTLTNYEHLTELIHAASRTHRTPSSLCAWFEAAVQKTAGEDRKLRLESEDNVVSIVTIHSSKGLEYPIVYLPQGESMTAWVSSATVFRLHRDGRTVLEIHPKSSSAPRELKEASIEELVRLGYVAMTRAAARLVLIVAQRARSKSSLDGWHASTASNAYHAALLGYLPKTWGKPEMTAVNDALESLPGVRLREQDELAVVPTKMLGEADAEPELRVDPADDVGVRWVTSSYTALAKTIEDGELSSKPVASFLADGTILHFGRGPRYGDALHRVMEHADYAQLSRIDDQAEAARLALCREVFDVTLPERGEAALLNEQAGSDMLRRVLNLELVPGLRLCEIPASDRAAEMEFLLTVHPDAGVEGLARALVRLGRAAGRDYGIEGFEPRLLSGFLTGSIDLALRARDGRFWVVDWKSNVVGSTREAYGQEALDKVMREHHYRLQYLLYLVALRRFLSSRLGPDFHDDLIAGAIYVFVRGLDDKPLVGGCRTGVVVDRVPAGVIAALDEFLASGWNEERFAQIEAELLEAGGRHGGDADDPIFSSIQR